MRQKDEITDTTPLPIKYIGTPITDDTFEKQGWTKIEGSDYEDDEFDGDFDDFTIEFKPDPNVFGDEYNEDDYDEDFDDFPFDMEPKYPNEGEWEDEYYFWVLKVPKYWPDDQCMTLISTTSDHHLPGFKKGEYIVEIYNEHGLGICQSEEQLEILYKALTGDDINE